MTSIGSAADDGGGEGGGTPGRQQEVNSVGYSGPWEKMAAEREGKMATEKEKAKMAAMHANFHTLKPVNCDDAGP